MMRSQRAVLHLVSPDSVRSWFEHFVTLGPDDRVGWLGEAADIDAAHLNGHLVGDRDVAVIHSSHHTLLRDVELGERLSRVTRGTVIHQTRRAALRGTDKLLMKTLFDELGLPSVPWRHASHGMPARAFARAHQGPFVTKQRRGTEGRSLRLTDTPVTDLGREVFEETFMHGTEYSVVIYRDDDRVVTLPAVWKGRTQIDLVPPYRRLRVCPSPYLVESEERVLRELSVRAVEGMNSVGLAEVELLVDDDGVARVIEVNPRVAGTMRMSALAAGERIFDLPTAPRGRRDLAPVRYTAELPAAGEAWSDAEAGMFCTSRLTVAADRPEDLLERVDLARARGTQLPQRWRDELDRVLLETERAR